jgi:hypothetical protein
MTYFLTYFNRTEFPMMLIVKRFVSRLTSSLMIQTDGSLASQSCHWIRHHHVGYLIGTTGVGFQLPRYRGRTVLHGTIRGWLVSSSNHGLIRILLTESLRSGPVIPFYYSLFYLKSEHALRTSFFISAGPLAGAFGGLIAYAVQSIKSQIGTWRILL